MRICAQCGHSNSEHAPMCAHCDKRLTLPLKSVSNDLSLTLPHKPPSQGASRIAVRELSQTLKTKDFEPKDMQSSASSMTHSYTSTHTASDDSKASATSFEQGQTNQGFSLLSASLLDADSHLITQQIEQHAMRDPLLGQEFGNVRLLEKIGKGGFGAVYRAEQIYVGEPLAVKMLHLHQVDNPEVVRRFQREARALSQLRHPNIVQMRDFGLLPPYGFYLIMDFLEGKTLYERLHAAETFPIHRLLPLFRQLCDVLSFVHQKGIIHRDLKLSNIHVGPNVDGHEHVSLLDFGIAAITDDVDSITKTGSYIGTATYASPEQVQGFKDLDGRSDLYALAVLLYRLLVGRPPFMGATSIEINHAKILHPAPALEHWRPKRRWALELETFLASCLQRDRTERPENADVFWEHCAYALEQQMALDEDDTPSERIVLDDPQAHLQTVPDVLASVPSQHIVLNALEYTPSSEIHTLDGVDESVVFDEPILLETSEEYSGATQEWSSTEHIRPNVAKESHISVLAISNEVLEPISLASTLESNQTIPMTLPPEISEWDDSPNALESSDSLPHNKTQRRTKWLWLVLFVALTFVALFFRPWT